MTPRRRFRFLKELAQGGFGKVYLAEMVTSDNFSSVVAIKLLHGRWTNHEEIAQRARDEARLLGRLRHPNIVRVEDLTAIRGQAAVIMEYLEGVDLKTMTNYMVNEGSRLPLGAVFEIIAAVASALEAAYSHVPLQGGEPLRLIHRDIKPSNVMITVSGDVKLLDFGTARANFEDREAKTQALAFGSQAYMAPERLLGDPDTPAGDIFSLGVTTYEIMSGGAYGKIHIRPERYDKAMNQRVDELDFSGLDPSLGEQVKALLRAMLAYEPSERPNASQLLEAMEALAEICTEMGLKRFARLFVKRALEAFPHEVSGDDDLAGSTLFEDRSATFDTEGLDPNFTTPPPEPDSVPLPPKVTRPEARPEPRAEPAPPRVPLREGGLEPVPIPPPPPLQPARTRYPDLPPDEVSEEVLPEPVRQDARVALGGDIGHLLTTPPDNFDDEGPTVLAKDPTTATRDTAPRVEDSTQGLPFPVVDEDSQESMPELPPVTEQPEDLPEPRWSPVQSADPEDLEPPIVEDPPLAPSEDAEPSQAPAQEEAEQAPTDAAEVPTAPAALDEEEPPAEPQAEEAPPPVQAPAEDEPSEDLSDWPHVGPQRDPDPEDVPTVRGADAAPPPEPREAEPVIAPPVSAPPVSTPPKRAEPTFTPPPLERELTIGSLPPPPPEPEPEPQRSRAPIYAALALLALLGLGGLGWALSQGDPEVEVAQVDPPPQVDPLPPDPKTDPTPPVQEDPTPPPVKDPKTDPSPQVQKDPSPVKGDPVPTVKDPPKTDPPPKDPDPPPDQGGAGDHGNLVIMVMPIGASDVVLTNASGYSKEWDGTGGRLKVEGVQKGTYRTKVTPKDGGAPRRSTVKVESGKTCTYRLDISDKAADWEFRGCE